MPFVVGETIGPYRILEQLGRGGMATVYKAYHAALDRYVAIKALHPAFMEDPNFLARFQREARVVAKLEHPNIVPIYDFAEYEGRPYLVMKFIEGETLKARMTEGILDQVELIQIVQTVGAGLSYAHQMGILHRDVKPSNVLLGYDGRIYLADFGLARIAQAGESTLSSDMMLGTPQYISPEQAMGLGELDERTDIYSFGVMLYEMIVGQVPFSADTPFSIIHDHIYTPLPLPRTVNPDVSESVERVLLKALAKERVDRYPDANSLADAFENAVLAGPGVVPVDIPPVPDATYITDSIEKSEPVMTSDSGITPEAEVVRKTQEVPVVTPTPIEIPKRPDDVSVSGAKPRRRFRWWFIPIGILIIIACCLCSLVAYELFNEFQSIDEPITDQLPASPSTPRPDAPPKGDAQAWIDDAPEDPYAWLNLAETYWMDGEYEQARGALNKALELAADDPDFYFESAYDLAYRGFWVESAHVYLRGIQRFYPDDVPGDLIDGFHEAVYWATDYYEADLEIPIPAIAEVDMAMERVAHARYQLYFGDIDESQRIVEEVIKVIKPGMPEATLLLAEIYFERGDIDTATNILNDLLARDDIPDWIREHIEYIVDDVFLIFEDALAEIDANPDDPEAYLYLFDISIAMGYYDEADLAIEQALRLAGEDPRIALNAGELAANHGAWLYAAQLYAHAGQLNPDVLTPELTEKIIQVLYYASIEDGSPELFGQMEAYLPDDERGILRGAYRDALIARHKLYYEDAAEAKIIIEDVVDRTPKLALPRLVQAEVYLFTDDISQSEAILLDLQSSRTTPPWVQEEVQFLLEAIKP